MTAGGLTVTPVSRDNAPALLHTPRQTDDKYSRGVLGMVTGSTQFPGAAILGVTAALSTGVGMVRYVGPPEVSALVMGTRPEVVVGPGRVTALVVGSGFPDIGDAELRAWVGELINTAVPVVLDAGAMVHRRLFPGPAILTPHAKELHRLARAFGAPADTPDQTALWLANRLDAVIIVKGHESLVVSPGGRASVLPAGPTWLATAGTGDVLAGIMGAVVTVMCSRQGDIPPSIDQMHDAAVLAGLIHLEAARRASTVDDQPAPLLPSELALMVRGSVADFIDR